MRLSTAKFSINYCKIKKIDIETLAKYSPGSSEREETNEAIKYSPFSINSVQCYHPNYSLFFQMNPHNYDSVAFNHKYHIIDLQTVRDSATNETVPRNVFVKFSPLLDPIRYLIGKYDSHSDKIQKLPKYDSVPDEIMDKYLNTQNASYTDNFFYYLSSQLANTHGFYNAVDYYGSFLGIQNKYRFDVLDELEYLNQSPFFQKNKGKLFDIETKYDPFANFGSRGNKNKIIIGNDDGIIDVDSIELDAVAEEECSDEPDLFDVSQSIEHNENETCEIIQGIPNLNSSTTSNSSTSSNSLVNYTDSDDESDTASITDSDDFDTVSSTSSSASSSTYSEDSLFVYIHNFPIQLICLEKCDGTLDELFTSDKIDSKIGIAALMQIIMILITYQKCFSFTHNDLHTNNIMYTNCEAEFIVYCYKNKYYKVPTYGRIFKIIDFGRAIYKFDKTIFCSDSFAPEGDASDQYNTDPFFAADKKRIDPNPSFDLCRLGCSIYNFVLDINTDIKTLDDFQKIINRWCQDDAGKNVMYKRNGEERYHDFKLYKMIARTVHKHNPQSQLEFPEFKQFLLKKGIKDDSCINIDTIPVYYG